jgi:hypothetical protein
VACLRTAASRRRSLFARKQQPDLWVKGVISPSRGAPGVFVDEAIKKWSTVDGARR